MLNGLAVRRMVISLLETARQPPGGGGYSIYPWVGRCCAAPHTLTLFKTEFQFLIPCLRQRKSILINIRACKNFAAYRPRKDIPFKTKIDKSIPCLRQKSRKTYPGWPPVPIKGVPPPPLSNLSARRPKMTHPLPTKIGLIEAGPSDTQSLL